MTLMRSLSQSETQLLFRNTKLKAALYLFVMAALAGLLLSGCATFKSLGEYRAKQMDRCAESCCDCRACPPGGGR